MSELISAEQKFLNTLKSHLRGYYLLLLGTQRNISWLPKNNLYNFTLSPSSGNSGNIISHYDALAVRNNSLDVIIIPYELENIDHPEILLRELHRCLQSNGKLFIFAKLKLHPFNWLKKALSVFRLKYLLTQADFECKQINWIYYGSIIVLQAQKNTPGLTPLRAIWDKKLALDNIEDKQWQPTPTTRDIHD